MSHPVLCGAVVLTSANNAIRWIEGASARTATIPAGTYYLRGQWSRNLVPQSENFTAWSASANCAVLPQSGTSPNGNTAYLLDMTSAVNGTGVSTTFVPLTGGTKSFSAYVRAGTAPITEFNFYDITASADRHNVRLTWSATGVPTLSTIGGSGTLFTPVSVGNGWYKISFTVNSVIGLNGHGIFVFPAGWNAATGSAFVWGVQVEERSIVGDYSSTIGVDEAGPSDDLILAILRAINLTASNGYEMTLSRSINPAEKHTTLTWTRTSGASTFGFLWDDAANTFDKRLLGFAGNTPNTGAAKVSTISCAANWVGNDVAREIEPYSDRIVSVPRAASGRVQGVSRSSRMQSWRLGLSFVDERRMLVDRALSAPSDTLEGFVERFGAGASFELHEVQGVTGTTLDQIHSIDTLVDVVHFSEDTLTGFRPQRIGPGVPLYSADLTMHAKV